MSEDNRNGDAVRASDDAAGNEIACVPTGDAEGPRQNAGMPAGGPPPWAQAGGPPPGAAVGGPQSRIDPVTGALNIGAFGKAFADAVVQGKLESSALWYVDVRNFRAINPEYGYETGNGILRAVAEGIDEKLSNGLPIMRLGGDRFVFVSAGCDEEHARDSFIGFVEYVNEHAKKHGIKQRLTLTGGVYYLREPELRSGDYRRALDYASIAHKNARRDRESTLYHFTDEDLERDQRRMTIEQTIDAALENNEVEVWYQPQIDYTYGEVIGAEALARWNHPELGWISPAEFIPVLENCGKVHKLDLYVWEEACRNAGKWRNISDGKPVPISVNVSRTEMFEDGLMEHFLDLQKRYDLPPGSLHLEVTESAFVEEAERLYTIIEEMRHNRMKVEMDDFGSGLSSLNMLKDVQVDVVKLDMGFMRSAVNEERGGVVLSSVIRMLQGLDTPIIAEGVETLEQAEMLKNMGCHLMQGFHFSRPMPLEEFEEFISSSSAVESTLKRKRTDSRLEDLMSFDATSSYLFNEAIGGVILFFVQGRSSESILVNDKFYEECGLGRQQFGNMKIDHIKEIDPDSRETMWRAAAEAREKGSAMCKAKVRITQRWIECVIRYISSSPRGDIYTLSICRSGFLDSSGNELGQSVDDMDWNMELLEKVVPNGFVKCEVNDDLTIDFISSELVEKSGLSHEEFARRFHNSLAEIIVLSDRSRVFEAIRDSMRAESLVDVDFNVYHGYGGEASLQMLGRVQRDENGVPWLYALLLIKRLSAREDGEGGMAERIIPFDYYLDQDRLVINYQDAEGNAHVFDRSGWLATIENHPEYITKASAAKVLATVRDLKHHPVSGFSDIKCNLLGGNTLRWFHVNYTCESDEAGNTTIIHGFAQDANDQMGSAKWWRQQAEVDYLTGLLNRNAAEQEINLSMRTNGRGMMFMIDLDNFKRVNDELGHLTGDALLRDVADTLEHCFRGSDVLGRYGGDEFVAFMAAPVTGAHELAARRANNIIEKIGAIQTPDGMHAGCSIGIAHCTNKEATFYDLLEVADQALYKSKNNGKGVYSIIEMS